MSGRLRNSYLDLLRVIGTIAVVVGHLSDSNVPRALIYSWHVPIFFVLSGYLAARRSVRDEVARRLSSLARPYVAWVLLIYLAYVAVSVMARGGLSWVQAIDPWIGGRWASAPFSAIWFVSALFVATVATRLIDSTGWGWPGRFGLGLALCVGLAVGPHQLSRLPLAVGQGLACVVFVQAGALASEYLTPLSIGTRALLSSAAVAGAAVLFATKAAVPLDLKSLDFGTPVLSAAAATALCVGLVIMPLRITGGVGRMISALAQTSLAVIFLHSLVLWSWPGVSPPWRLLALALIAPWVVGFVLSATPLAATFGCATRPRPRARPARA
ncbi:MAG: acyltransferase family protein [Tetrasphaera sp.]|nr:acyltransferase family protein [Tetrasphaera sp.]